MEITIDYLNEERVKLWGEITTLKQALTDAIAKLSQTDKATVSSLQSINQSLEEKIALVKRIADEKTPEDVQTASKAAQDVVKMKAEVEGLYKATGDTRDRLAGAQKALKRIQAISENSNVAGEEIERNKARVGEAAKTIDGYLAQINDRKSTIDNLLSKIDVALRTSTEKSQDVANLRTQVSSAASEISVTKESLQELKEALLGLREEQEKTLNSSRQSFEQLSTDNQSRFDKLFANSEKRINELADAINGLLPGATSVALGTAFNTRKREVGRNKWWWALLLISAALCIVGFGLFSLKQVVATQSLTMIPVRIVVIAGLVIIEEFARRNYNVCSRLSEAYGYKEAIATSYLGFKNELSGIDMPKPEDAEKTPSISALAEVFIAKLGDEPGKKVFDKERPALGLTQVISKMSSAGEDPATDKVQLVTTAASALSKVSWPLVALIAILSVAGCAAIWLLKHT